MTAKLEVHPLALVLANIRMDLGETEKACDRLADIVGCDFSELASIEDDVRRLLDDPSGDDATDHAAGQVLAAIAVWRKALRRRFDDVKATRAELQRRETEIEDQIAAESGGEG